MRYWINKQLFKAIKDNNVEDIKTALNQGAEINTTEHLGSGSRTVLHHAVRYAGTEVVSILLQANAAISAREFTGQTALQYLMLENAKRDNAQKLVKQLLGEEDAVCDTICLAAWQGCIDKLEQIHHKDYYQDKRRNSLVHYAAAGGDTLCLEWLFNRGYLVNKRNRNHDTPLLLAALNGQFASVQWLLSKGALITKKNKRGDTPLIAAASNGHNDIIQLLRDNGASIKEKNKRGDTALLIATALNQLETVKYLLKNGASIIEKNEDDITALLGAAIMGNLEIIKFLVEQEAALDRKSYKAAIERAQEYNQKAISCYLVSAFKMQKAAFFILCGSRSILGANTRGEFDRLPVELIALILHQLDEYNALNQSQLMRIIAYAKDRNTLNKNYSRRSFLKYALYEDDSDIYRPAKRLKLTCSSETADIKNSAASN